MKNDHNGDSVVVPEDILAMREAEHLRYTIRALGKKLWLANLLCLAVCAGLIVWGRIKTGSFPDMLLLILCVFILVAARLHAVLHHE
jgi:hypothetical protein